jgi:hypothetical protein
MVCFFNHLDEIAQVEQAPLQGVDQQAPMSVRRSSAVTRPARPALSRVWRIIPPASINGR